MRLHTLTLQAFGPYAEPQTVDFDQLNEAGVFLLTGPTGAGKTSVLDAVCFALYGTVPGDREVRGLRSAHASPDLATRVQLELTLGGRRLRVERWPEWQRPKKRGEGTTTERAGATLVEIAADGSERLVSARVQEVGHELGPLLGMTSEQFKQVVLLPQGGFSTFLKADSDQRRDVLEKLFATQRFTRIEAWVHERAGQLRKRAELARAELLQLLAAMSHRAAAPLPDDLDEASLGAWRAAVLDHARQALEVATADEVAARERARQAQSDERQVSQCHALGRRRAQAEADLRDLAASDDEAERADAQLRDHRRAAGVLPLLAPLREAESRLTRCRAAVDDARAALSGRLDEPVPTDRSGCEAAAACLHQRIGELRGLEPLVARMDEARARRHLLQSELALAADELERVSNEAESMPRRRDELVTVLAQARELAARREECEQRLREATERREAAEALPAVAELVGELEARARSAHERHLEARSCHLDLVERRLRGMAAELASALTTGAPCQVCGSTDHPAPATPAPGAVTREQQEAAEAAVEEARRDQLEAEQALAEARQQQVLLQQAAGGADADSAGRAEGTATEELQRASAAVQQVASLEEQVAELDAAVRDAGLRVDQARERRDDLTRRLAAAVEVVAGSEPQVRLALGDCATLDAALAAATEQLELVRAAAAALAAWHEADDSHEECRREAERAASAAGFRTVDDAREAVLDDEEGAGLDELLARRAAVRARAQGVLDEPEVQALSEAGVPPHSDADLARARAECDATDSALQQAAARLHAALQDHGALLALDDQVAAAAAAWAPAREEHELAESMSRLVRGMGGDNHLQMRLSSYVLATRLDQVLEAADERLQQMRDNRYTFQRSSRARAGRRSGLDIEVLDDWTGELRPPSSLSGGETFKLSLALALGLADVITHESGGLDIETLFIDEGFGMLDPDTLDEVMDCIDDLRSGGRAVGVVSHVTELRSRISAQLHVSPSREGSRIRMATTPV